jgi:DNA gyrase inhibitor GyrI
MADAITEKHLKRLRIRGAPSTIPGVQGLVGDYDAEETWRQTCRALVTPLDRGFTPAMLRDAYARLADAAARQKATTFDGPMFGLKGDPAIDPPHKWEYEAVLPIRGAAGKPEEGITTARIQGGMHIQTMTRGLADLEHLYVWVFGKFLPSKKQQLMRPYLLHAVVAGLDQGPHVHDAELVIAVWVPAVLSIKPVPVPGESAEA